MARDNARSNADLDRNYKDSVLSIIAPSLTGSKGYQLAKLKRDYGREKGRMGEDQAQASQDLERGRGRNLEDIARTSQRGFQDINREATRGREDLTRGNERFGEDTAREQTRASSDLQKQTTDALTDATIQAKEAEIQHARTLTDIDKQYARDKQDLALAEADASREHTRALEDLAKQEKRAAEDFKETMTEIQHAREVFARDMNLTLTQMGVDLADKTGSGKNYTADDISNAAGLGKVNTADPNSTAQSGDTYAGNLAKKLLGQYASGTDYVPQTGPYLLHEGEGVITAAANKAGGYMSTLGGKKASAAGGANSGSGGTFDLAAIQAQQAAQARALIGSAGGKPDNAPSVFRPDYDFSKDVHNYTSGALYGASGDGTSSGIGGGSLGGSAPSSGGYSGIGAGGPNYLRGGGPAGPSGHSMWQPMFGPRGSGGGGNYGYQPPMGRGGFGGGSGVNLNIHVNNNGEQKTIQGASDKIKSFVGGLFNAGNAAVY
jgi:hypothetical protein